MRYNLSKDSNIMLIKFENGKVGIFKRNIGMEKLYIGINDCLFEMSENSYVEEIFSENDKVKLMVTYHDKDNYEVKIINIDLINNNIEKVRFSSKNIPQKITSNFYHFLGCNTENTAICDIRDNGKNYYIIDDVVYILKKINIDCSNLSFNFSSVDEEKMCDIFCLSIKILSVDILHILFKLDDEIRVFNDFYSEKTKDKKISFYINDSNVKVENGTITLKDFYCGLINYFVKNGIKDSIEELYQKPKEINAKVKSRILRDFSKEQ